VVLGGGVVGLTTAVRLLEAGYRVRVVARNFEEGACSRRR
jgi:phytoene dehydrogenase-like protein